MLKESVSQARSPYVPAEMFNTSMNATSNASIPVTSPKYPPIFAKLKLAVLHPASPAASRKNVIHNSRKMLHTALFDRKVTIHSRNVKTPPHQ